MVKEKIAITGSEGIIGNVLKAGLQDAYDITPINTPEVDVSDYSALVAVLPNHSAIIHLAWDDCENFQSDTLVPQNAQMYLNVYKAALELGIKRVIMASSVHADTFYGWTGELMSPNSVPTPDSLYGADKVMMESLGRHFSKNGLEVVCIRFGGINPDDTPPPDDFPIKEERGAWLSHADCVSLIKEVLGSKEIPGNFILMYGISDNKERVQDVSNPFGWKPQPRV